MFRAPIALSAFAVCAISFVAPQPTIAATALVACTEGTTEGSWILPPSSSEPGKAQGKLAVNGVGTHTLDAELYETPGCLPCITGIIEGKIKDVNTNTAYRITGSYSGSRFTNRGTFVMDIRTLVGDVSVGEITGDFVHRPLKPFGSFSGRFELCP